MTAKIFDLPVTGIAPAAPPRQGTQHQLGLILQPLVDDPGTAEFGWTQTWIGVDSDPELFDVRKIWVRTTSKADKDKTHYELRLFAHDHPTLGSCLYDGVNTPYKYLVNTFFNGIRYGNFRDVLLKLYGTGADVTVSKSGVVLSDPHGDVPEIEYTEVAPGVKTSTPESVAAYNAWWDAHGETTDWR